MDVTYIIGLKLNYADRRASRKKKNVLCVARLLLSWYFPVGNVNQQWNCNERGVPACDLKAG